MLRLFAGVLLVAAGSLAAAHSPEDDYHGQAFAQFGIGGCSFGIQHAFREGCGVIGSFVGGGEGFIYRGLAFGGEGGWAWINRDLKAGAGLVSLNFAYHFKGLRRSGGLVPFVSGGYSMVFRDAHVSGLNVGGGATWWAARRAGLRFEGRLYHFNTGPLGASVFLFRLGVAFR